MGRGEEGGQYLLIDWLPGGTNQRPALSRSCSGGSTSTAAAAAAADTATLNVHISVERQLPGDNYRRLGHSNLDH